MTLIWVKKKLTLTKQTIKTHIFKWNFAERSDCYTQFMCERDPNKQLKEKHITQHNIEFKIIISNVLHQAATTPRALLEALRGKGSCNSGCVLTSTAACGDREALVTSVMFNL